MATETLTCESGHTWTRNVAKGKKPKRCPEHRTVKAETKTPVDPAENLAKARAVKAESQQRKQTSIDRQVQEILADDRINIELKRKLEYAHKYVHHSGMVDVRTALIREAKKNVGSGRA